MRSRQEGLWKPGVLFSFWMYRRLPSSVSISRSVCNFTSTGTVRHEFRVSDCKWSSVRRELRGKVYNCEASETLVTGDLGCQFPSDDPPGTVRGTWEDVVLLWGPQLGFRCRGWTSKFSMLLFEYMIIVAEIGQQFWFPNSADALVLGLTLYKFSCGFPEGFWNPEIFHLILSLHICIKTSSAIMLDSAFIQVSICRSRLCYPFRNTCAHVSNTCL